MREGEHILPDDPRAVGVVQLLDGEAVAQVLDDGIEIQCLNRGDRRCWLAHRPPTWGWRFTVNALIDAVQLWHDRARRAEKQIEEMVNK